MVLTIRPDTLDLGQFKSFSKYSYATPPKNSSGAGNEVEKLWIGWAHNPAHIRFVWATEPESLPGTFLELKPL